MDTLLSPRRRSVLQALGAAALLAACGERRGAAVAPVALFRGPTMGSSYSVKIAGADLSATAQTAAHDAVRAALNRVDVTMSTHRYDSELSHFNRHGAASGFALSPDTFAVFALGQRVSAMTDGAFDVTVGPVVDAWGFGPRREFRVVGPAEVAALERSIGWRMLALDAPARTATKARPEVRADLSGIAKGYAVDQAARALDALGIERYMIEAGGEVRARGINGEGRPWQIGIEQPDANPPRARYVVPLDGRSLATSGDYRIFFEHDGNRYCHEIDPATGRPIANGVASVSVAADECALADALATALMVMGPERGYAFATAQQLAAHFVVRTADGRFVDRLTPAFAALGGRALERV